MANASSPCHPGYSHPSSQGSFYWPSCSSLSTLHSSPSTAPLHYPHNTRKSPLYLPAISSMAVGSKTPTTDPCTMRPAHFTETPGTAWGTRGTIWVPSILGNGSLKIAFCIGSTRFDFWVWWGIGILGLSATLWMRTFWCRFCAFWEWLIWVLRSGRGRGLGEELIFLSSMLQWGIIGQCYSPNMSKIVSFLCNFFMGLFCFCYLVWFISMHWCLV